MKRQRTVYLLGPERVELRTVPVPDPGPGELLLRIEAATLAEPLACVLHGLEVCALDRPSEVVVYGGGPIGLLFVDVLSSLRAGHHVVLADPNLPRLEVARQLGASEAIQVSRDGGEAA